MNSTKNRIDYLRLEIKRIEQIAAVYKGCADGSELAALQANGYTNKLGELKKLEYHLLKNSMDFSKVEVEDMYINMHDYPDFCDSYIITAYWSDTGRELTERELDIINEDFGFVYEQVVKRLF